MLILVQQLLSLRMPSERTGPADGMIGRLNALHFTEITLSELCPRFVLSILLPPLDLVVTAPTHVFVGRGEDLRRLFRFGIVVKGELVGVGGCPAFAGGFAGVGALGHGGGG